MPPSRNDLKEAVAAYWAAKDSQRRAAEAAQSTAEGTAKAVRGAGHFNPVANLIARFFTEAGYPPDSVSAKGSATVLPGHFRPNKAWDLVVIHKGVLVAAIELKALGSPSHGKNFNNRIEEALGNAIDLSQAGLNRLVGNEKPWLGYFFLIEDTPESRATRMSRANPTFANADEWSGMSQQERFALAGLRLVQEGIYDSVCYIASSPRGATMFEPEPQLDWRHFSAAIDARLTYLANLGLP